MFGDLNFRRRRQDWNKRRGGTKVMQEEMQNQNNINDLLSTETMIHIFSYIDNPRELSRSVMPVCRLWYQLANESILWKSLEFCYQSLSTHKIMIIKL